MMKTKRRLLIICFFALMFLPFFKIDVSAHESYFLAVTIDEASNQYIGEIVSENGDNHREKDIIDFGAYVDKDKHKMKNIDLPLMPNDEQDAKDLFKIYSSASNDMLYYTFPSIHSVGWFKEKIDASDNDLALVQRVVDYPLSDLNRAISFIIEKTGWKKGSSKESLADIGTHLANYEKSFTVNGVQVSAKRDTVGEGVEAQSIKKDWYVTLTINGESEQFIYKCYKGYYYKDETERANDKLFYMSSSRYSNYLKLTADRGDIKCMTWKMLVFQGNFNFANGTTYSNITNITAPSEFENMFIGLISGALNSIRSFLGLYSLEELMTNNGSRNSSYDLGMFPNSWMNSAILLHVICQMIAWGLIGFSIIKMLWKKQIATMNIGEKIALQEGIKNLILCGMLLGSFTIIFNFLARLNYRLVDLFASSTQDLNLTRAASSGSTFGGLAVALGVFALTVYFNFFYIVRAIELAILYGIAPLCIYTLSLGGKTASVFTTFMKELVGNLFMQTVHALLIAFFSNVFLSGTTKTFEALVIMYSFIPIGGFIRKKIFGLEEGLGGQVAQTMGAMAGGAAGAMIGGVGKAKDSVGSGGSKGGSGGKQNDGSLNQTIDNKTKNPSGNADISLNDKVTKKGAYKPNKGSVIGTTATGGQNESTAKALRNSKGGIVAKRVAKGAANVGLAGVKAMAGMSVAMVAPKAGEAMFHSAGKNMGKAASNLNPLGMARDLKQTNNFKDSLKKNGVSSMTTNPDFTSYKIGGKFGDDGQLSYQDKNGNPMEGINESNVKDYEAMYDAQSALGKTTGDFNYFTKADIDAAKASGTITKEQAGVLNNMQRNQVRLNADADGGYSVIRRSEDVNKMQNALDRADPLAGITNSSGKSSTIRLRNNNQNAYSNRTNTKNIH